MNTQSESLAHELKRLIQSSKTAHNVRACLLSTRDRDFGLALVKMAASDADCDLHHFTAAGKRHYLRDEIRWETLDATPAEPFALLQQAASLKEGGLVVFEDCVPFMKDENGDQRLRMLLAQLLSTENRAHPKGLTLIFLEAPHGDSHLPAILSEQFIRIDIPYPHLEELEDIAREELSVLSHALELGLDLPRIKQEADRLKLGLAGLTRAAARDALRDIITETRHDFKTAAQRLQERKAAQLKRELSMNVLVTENLEKPIGLDYLMEYIAINKDRMNVYGGERAKGILLVGPPGSGKTMLARSIGKAVNLPVVEFRISALMNSLLGETEQRFARAFAALEAMAPNVVFIDEIEKAFGDSSERDGGTMMRCTGALLSWLSDNPYPNFIVATSNSLTRMGEIGLTMTRSERFDGCFFVDVPGRASRKAMLCRWLESAADNASAMAEELADLTAKFSGADLRALVKQACARAAFKGEPVTRELLTQEVARKQQRVAALYTEFEGLRHWGRLYCDPAGPTDA